MLTADTTTGKQVGRLGRWSLESVLGTGSLGSVFAGRDGDGNRAAIKTLRPSLATSPVLRRRLERELEVIRKVPHGGTAALLDADPGGDPPFVATELVDGPTLRTFVETSGPLSERASVVLAGRLASTLARIHAAGIAHRDLKPSNVVIGRRGPVLIDFGIASLVDHDDSTRLAPGEGSPGWLAPEQVVGTEVGTPADVFAWASVVTYAATGIGPFGVGRGDALAFRVLHQRPAIDAVPAALRSMVDAALAKDPADRPSARALVDHLVVRPFAA